MGKGEVEKQVFTNENWSICKIIDKLHKGNFTWSDRGSQEAVYLPEAIVDYSLIQCLQKLYI